MSACRSSRPLLPSLTRMIPIVLGSINHNISLSSVGEGKRGIRVVKQQESSERLSGACLSLCVLCLCVSVSVCYLFMWTTVVVTVTTTHSRADSRQKQPQNLT